MSNVQTIVEILQKPWHWSLAGVMIALILFLLTYLGRSFGVSASFKTICNAFGLGKKYEYFDFDIKNDFWQIAFLLGVLLGGLISVTILYNPEPAKISQATIDHLATDFGWNYPQGDGYLPVDVFNIYNWKAIVIALVGGAFVGFGARYGNGCTSGHAITGLSHMRLPSLITVIGFFIGGLIMTWLIMPFIFGN